MFEAFDELLAIKPKAKPKAAPKRYPTRSWVNDSGDRIGWARKGRTHTLTAQGHTLAKPDTFSSTVAERTTVAEADAARAELMATYGGVWTEQS